MLKKTFALLICIVLVLSLAACGKDDVTNNSTGNLSSKTDMELPEYNPTSDVIIELTEGDPSLYDDPTNWAYYLNSKLKAVYGVEVQCIRTSHELFPTNAAQLVMSGQSPDILQYRHQDDPTFIKNGIVQSVDDLYDFSHPLFAPLKEINEQFRYKDGKLYSFIRTFRNEGYTYYWLEDLQELGLEMPRDLYYKGEWTWSKFLEYAKKLTVKSSDGTISRYGGTVSNDFHAITGHSYVKFENGKYTNNLRNSALADFYNSFSAALFQDKILEASTSIITSFNMHTVSIALDNRKMYENHAKELWAQGLIDFAPSPKWDNADKYYVPTSYGAHWIAKDAPNREGAAAYSTIHCYLYYKYDEAYNKFSEENNKKRPNYTKEVEELSLDMLFNKENNFELVFIRDEGIGTNWSNGQRLEFVRGATRYNKSWAALVEQNYPLLNAAINEAN